MKLLLQESSDFLAFVLFSQQFFTTSLCLFFFAVHNTGSLRVFADHFLTGSFGQLVNTTCVHCGTLIGSTNEILHWPQSSCCSLFMGHPAGPDFQNSFRMSSGDSMRPQTCVRSMLGKHRFWWQFEPQWFVNIQNSLNILEAKKHALLDYVKKICRFIP